jgi:hypothetical protein
MPRTKLRRVLIGATVLVASVGLTILFRYPTYPYAFLTGTKLVSVYVVGDRAVYTYRSKVYNRGRVVADCAHDELLPNSSWSMSYDEFGATATNASSGESIRIYPFEVFGKGEPAVIVIERRATQEERFRAWLLSMRVDDRPAVIF